MSRREPPCTLSSGGLGSRIFAKSDPTVVHELGAVLRFGRSSRSDVMIDSSRVSRHHAEIRALQNNLYCVWDCKSRNGTFINGVRVVGSRVLRDGDEISVGGHEFVFLQVGAGEPSLVSGVPHSDGVVTDVGLDERRAITLVSDIRRYTTLSEKYGREFQTLVAEWFRGVLHLIERCRGIVDKVHGDGVLAYWWLPDDAPREHSVCLALQACDGIMVLRDRFAARLREELSGEQFDVGVAVHMGGVLLGNLGTGSMQAFTAVGDAVNATFRLEALTKTMGHAVLVSQEVAQHAPPEFTLVGRGQVAIRGSSVSLSIASLEGYRDRGAADGRDDELASTQEATHSLVDDAME